MTVLKQDTRQDHLIVAEAGAKCLPCLGSVMASCRGVQSEAEPCETALLGEDGDHVVALRGSHSLACVLLTVNLVLHKEMSLLFEVDVAV